MRIVLLDCDYTGHRSVLDLVQQGTVAAYPCRTLADAEGVMWGLVRKQIEADLVIVDTITNLANKTVQDVVLSPTESMAKSIAGNLSELKASFNDYGKAGSGIVRILRPIFELECPSIFVAHEKVREDPMSGLSKFSPDLQAMVLSSVVSWADAIVRLCPTGLPMQLPDGRVIPPGTRQLMLASTFDSACGVRTHVPVPPVLYDPTLADFVQTVGGTPPHLTVLYGPPKVGKTTFACGADRRIPAAPAA